MTPREAGQHLREMMAAQYEGRSVRTPAEFKRDLDALRIAADTLDPDELEEWAVGRSPKGEEANP